MIRKITYIICCTLFLVQTYAQKAYIGTNNEAFAFSNSLNNHFVNQLLLNRFITLDEIEANKLHSTNYFFAEMNNSLYYTNYLKGSINEEATGIHFSLTSRTIATAKYNPDAYQIIFKGNASYADKTANLSNLAIHRQSYQTIEAGYFKSVVHDDWLYYAYAGFGIVKGQRNDALTMNRFTLYTQPDGEYLDVNAKLQYNYCENGKSLLAMNGAGGATHIHAIMQNKKNGWRIELEAKDVGFIKWMNSAQQTSIDTVFRFEGFPVNLLSNNVSQTMMGDTLTNLLNSHTSNYRKTTILPAVFSVSVAKTMNDKVTFIGGLRYYAFSNMRFPYTSFDVKYQLNEKYSITGLLRYGIYNNLNIGFSTNITVLSNWMIRLDVLNLAGFILPNQMQSQGVFLGLHYKIEK